MKKTDKVTSAKYDDLRARARAGAATLAELREAMGSLSDTSWTLEDIKEMATIMAQMEKRISPLVVHATTDGQ